MGDEDDEHRYDCPGKPSCHCGYAPLAKEAVRRARLDALEEAASFFDAYEDDPFCASVVADKLRGMKDGM